ncbi:hypothetical protein CLM71_12730 [Serratia sp. MYb239]|nr:hypothetical protein CLM71_12730 [Serratia sp. MYb239]
MPKSTANKFYKNVKQFSFVSGILSASHQVPIEKSHIITMILLIKPTKIAIRHTANTSRAT